MTQNLYTIFDTVAKTAGPIWTAQNDEVAIRNFNYHLKEAHVASPEDFIVYRLGSFNHETLELITETLTEVIKGESNA